MIHRPADPTPRPAGAEARPGSRPTGAAPEAPAAGAETPAASLRAAYRGLRQIGLSEAEAGNLSAHLAGLGHTRQGWRFVEVQRLLFIRTLVDTGRLRP